MISIVTPWSGDTLDLMPDYDTATAGAQLVFVNNASGAATAEGLRGLPADRGIVMHNTTNRGFASANNQGYAAATGDIVIFLNSDIAGDPAWLRLAADDIRDGALYGPSLSQQLVYGRWTPYVEGWCIGATRKTWDAIRQRLRHETGDDHAGPWDATGYPGPYWEDNDLAFRAATIGISLIQTQWPIQHKGGRTAGPIRKHGASMEANRATFVRTVERHANV